MKITGRSALVAFAAFTLTPLPAHAQKLSDKTITFVVPTTAGTSMDILARLMADELKQRWGQTAIVENKAGASHSIGIQMVARAEPDGHTLLVAANTLVTNVGLFKTLPYDPVKGVVPVAELAIGALALAVHPMLPVNSVREFIEYAKKRPEQINYASPGPGTTQHLAMELFKLATQVDLTHVPYPGSAGAARDIAGGHVSVMFIPLQQALPMVEAKAIRLLALSTAQRFSQAPNVPTLAEEGIKGAEVDSWFGLLATGGTPRPVIERYNAFVNDFLKTPRIRTSLETQALLPRGGSADSFHDLIVKDLERWTRVVREAGIAVAQ
jgi:tripartite-type tricarboxylate transporter receptor subunit TctC